MNIEVRVGMDENILNNPACPGVYSGGKSVYTIDCGGMRGNWIGVRQMDGDFFHICEVEAWGV